MAVVLVLFGYVKTWAVGKGVGRRMLWRVSGGRQLQGFRSR